MDTTRRMSSLCSKSPVWVPRMTFLLHQIRASRRLSFLLHPLLGRVSSPLCVYELRLACSRTQLCQYMCIYWLCRTTTCFGLYRPSSGCFTRGKGVSLLLSSFTSRKTNWQWPIKAETCSCSTKSINTPILTQLCSNTSQPKLIHTQRGWHTS